MGGVGIPSDRRMGPCLLVAVRKRKGQRSRKEKEKEGCQGFPNHRV